MGEYQFCQTNHRKRYEVKKKKKELTHTIFAATCCWITTVIHSGDTYWS